MKLKAIIQDSETGNIFDITSIMSDITLDTELHGQAGKLTFTTLKDNTAKFDEGSRIQIKWGDKGIFFGYVFKRKTTEKGNISVTCYDQLRYFKNKDVYINKGETLATTFKKIIGKFNLQGEVMDDSGYICAPKIHENKSLYDILKYSIEQNLIGMRTQYFIYDDFGTIRLQNVFKMQKGYVFGDKSMMTRYSYEKSIDDNTYNQIKLVYHNKDTHEYNDYVTIDSATQKKWGILQYYKSIPTESNQGLISEYGANLLKMYNVENEKLSFDAIAVPNDDGIWDLRAGCIIYLRMKTSIGNIGMPEDRQEAEKGKTYLLPCRIDKCRHVLKNENYHSLNITVSKVVASEQEKS
ncbi:XkdQ/YqbQ family protein [Anaerosinus massiliensis]|uniref:XkdQ/YqbQ family protein n=1 Tax=Massilibacillus massiliensis TaxID=1806837 RepID=UPI000AAFCDF2|nr:hypothetical protein [Massilibacillus massiliensis]